MIDTEFIKKHVEHRDRVDRRKTGDDTVIRIANDRRVFNRRISKNNPLDCDVRFTKLQAAAILAGPILFFFYLIYKMVCA